MSVSAQEACGDLSIPAQSKNPEGENYGDKETKGRIKKWQDKVPQQSSRKSTEKVLKKLTPEVRRQYFIWDEILKRQIEKYPVLLFP